MNPMWKGLLTSGHPTSLIYFIFALYHWEGSATYFKAVFIANLILCLSLSKPALLLKRSINVGLVCFFWAIELFNNDMIGTHNMYTLGNKEIFELFSLWTFRVALWILSLFLLVRCVLKFVFKINSVEFLMITQTFLTEGGISDKHFNSLPSLVYRKSKDSDSSSRQEEMCSICIEEFHEGEELKMMPECKHTFHHNCIKRWIQNHNNCPYCRCTILTEGDQETVTTHTTTLNCRMLSERSSSNRNAVQLPI